MTDFGDFVRRTMTERGLSLRALSRAVNYDPGYVSRVLSGKQRPSPLLTERLDRELRAEGALTALASTLTPDDRDRVNGALDAPSRLDQATVTALADVLAAQRRLDDVMPAVAMLPATTAQWKQVKRLAGEARGPHAGALHRVAAEWVQFIGWLHAEARNDPQALTWLSEAEARADDVGDGALAAQAANFKGYLARQQERPHAVVRWFLAAYHTPGATLLQRVGDAVQAAHGYALLGERDAARRLLDEATALTDRAATSEPPGTAYWLSPTFSRMGIGLALLALAEYADAAENLRTGLDGLPADQRGAEWAREYRDALECAREAA
ncbi:helix-turn-helix domain-containing protein [Nocardiopsis sp. CNT-189]|uniref:helix-turn-helix domain-containing protein n=1 Tax=Nocardiopsis oceanisediminis TaxID=2816862 RepID=UPI003B32F9D7